MLFFIATCEVEMLTPGMKRYPEGSFDHYWSCREMLLTSRLFIVYILVVSVHRQRQTLMPRALGCTDVHLC